MCYLAICDFFRPTDAGSSPRRAAYAPATMDARAERIRRLRRAAAAWWVLTFLGTLGILLAVAGASGYHAAVRGRGICVVLELKPDDRWVASAFWSEDRPKDRAAYPPDGRGCIVELPARGSRQGNGLGLYRGVVYWKLRDAGVIELPVLYKEACFGQTPETWEVDILPREAHREIVYAIERDVLAGTAQRDQLATLLWDDPSFDTLFTVWRARHSGWQARVFWNECVQDMFVAAIAASIIAGLRFAIPLLVRRLPAGCCRQCGYDLAGLAPTGDKGDVTCPECGAASTLDKKS